MSRRSLEHAIQKQIADALTLEVAPPGRISQAGVVWWSIDQASYAGTAPGARLGRGVIAGVPDTFVLYRGRTHLIEIKTVSGVLSGDQQAVIAASWRGGAEVGVARDAFEALLCLDQWRIPRNGRVHGLLPMRVRSGVA